MGDTTISWTDKTWNPVRGCSKVSPGCTHCYAERVAVRFSGPGQPYEGLADRERGRWTGVVRMVPEHLADPLRWRKPVRVFVNSMSDLFHESLGNEQIAAVFGVMAAARRHTFQVLTKRAERMRDWFRWLSSELIDEHGGTHDISDTLATYAADELGDGSVGDQEEWYDRLVGLIRDSATFPSDVAWPLRNVWLGVSVEDQERADERIPLLLETPAAVRFLSCEPLLDAVDVKAFLARGSHRVCPACLFATNRTDDRCPNDGAALGPDIAIDWIIAGCESGPGARPCDVSWLRSLRDQCAGAGVPFFLKQATHHHGGAVVNGIAVLTHAVQDGDGSRVKAGGVIELPYLDGVQHAAFPEVQR